MTQSSTPPIGVREIVEQRAGLIDLGVVGVASDRERQDADDPVHHAEHHEPDAGEGVKQP